MARSRCLDRWLAAAEVLSKWSKLAAAVAWSSSSPEIFKRQKKPCGDLRAGGGHAGARHERGGALVLLRRRGAGREGAPGPSASPALTRNAPPPPAAQSSPLLQPGDHRHSARIYAGTVPWLLLPIRPSHPFPARGHGTKTIASICHARGARPGAVQAGGSRGLPVIPSGWRKEEGVRGVGSA